MDIIKLNAIDSTNTYLKQMAGNTSLKDYTVVVADHQTSGRGQMGTVWETEAGKNLTFSVFKQISCLERDELFYLSMAVSLAITTALEEFNIPQLKIKWPNDILSVNSKICGILIENILKSNQMKAAVIGIGLNVNQTDFSGLINASSMKAVMGIHFNRDEVMSRIVAKIEEMEGLIVNREFTKIKAAYEEALFRKDKPSTFKERDGNLLMGFIQGVNPSGKLVLKLEDNILKEFDLKELTLLY